MSVLSLRVPLVVLHLLLAVSRALIVSAPDACGGTRVVTHASALFGPHPATAAIHHVRIFAPRPQAAGAYLHHQLVPGDVANSVANRAVASRHSGSGSGGGSRRGGASVDENLDAIDPASALVPAPATANSPLDGRKTPAQPQPQPPPPPPPPPTSSLPSAPSAPADFLQSDPLAESSPHPLAPPPSSKSLAAAPHADPADHAVGTQLEASASATGESQRASRAQQQQKQQQQQQQQQHPFYLYIPALHASHRFFTALFAAQSPPLRHSGIFVTAPPLTHSSASAAAGSSSSFSSPSPSAARPPQPPSPLPQPPLLSSLLALSRYSTSVTTSSAVPTASPHAAPAAPTATPAQEKVIHPSSQYSRFYHRQQRQQRQIHQHPQQRQQQRQYDQPKLQQQHPDALSIHPPPSSHQQRTRTDDDIPSAAAAALVSSSGNSTANELATPELSHDLPPSSSSQEASQKHGASVAPLFNACKPLSVAADEHAMRGRVAVVSRGVCDFAQKVLNMQAAGAVAVMVVNFESQGDFLANMKLNETKKLDTTIRIPSLMISFNDWRTIAPCSANTTVEFTVRGEATFDVNQGREALNWAMMRGMALWILCQCGVNVVRYKRRVSEFRARADAIAALPVDTYSRPLVARRRQMAAQASAAAAAAAETATAATTAGVGGAHSDEAGERTAAGNLSGTNGPNAQDDVQQQRHAVNSETGGDGVHEANASHHLVGASSSSSSSSRPTLIMGDREGGANSSSSSNSMSYSSQSNGGSLLEGGAKQGQSRRDKATGARGDMGVVSHDIADDMDDEGDDERERRNLLGSPGAAASSSSSPSSSSRTKLGDATASASTTVDDGGGGDESEESACAICLEDFEDGDEVRILACSHVYHRACIDPWLQSSSNCCPLCKREIANLPPPPAHLHYGSMTV